MAVIPDSLREKFFAIFYILTERNQDAKGTAAFLEIFWVLAYLIDAGQVLRTLVVSEFGWSGTAVNVIAKVDLVYLLLNQVNFFRILKFQQC